MIEVLLLLLGILIGSLINGLADDLPRRITFHFPSHCPNCDAVNPPLRRVALIGFFTPHRRCANCSMSLSWRTLFVEIISSAMLFFLYQKFGLTLKFGLLALLMECLLLITVIDLEHRLILYVTVIPSAFIALIYGIFGAGHDLSKTLLGGAAGFGFIYSVYLFGWVFSKVMTCIRGQELDEVVFGGGDVYLSGVIGLAVGWSGIVLALFMAIMVGGASAAIYLIIAILRRRYNVFTPIPYGPFLVLGAIVLLVFSEEIRVYYRLSG